MFNIIVKNKEQEKVVLGGFTYLNTIRTLAENNHRIKTLDESPLEYNSSYILYSFNEETAMELFYKYGLFKNTFTEIIYETDILFRSLLNIELELKSFYPEYGYFPEDNPKLFHRKNRYSPSNEYFIAKPTIKVSVEHLMSLLESRFLNN
jgi:hypothetical protein